MHRTRWTAVLTMALALTASGKAFAVWSEQQITAKSAAGGDRVYTVTSKPQESLVQVTVTAAARSGARPISPYAHANLSLYEGETYRARIPVGSYWEGDTIKFTFEVSPSALQSSHFEIREQGWTVLRDSKGKVLKDHRGKPETEQTLGGQAVWFFLKDFLPPAKQ